MLGLLSILFAFYWYFVPSKRYISIFTIFFISTQGFQFFPPSFFEIKAAGITKTHDWIILLMGLIFFVQPQIFFNKDIWLKNKPIILLFLILFILVFYSSYVIHVEPKIIFSVFRSYIFFILIFLFIPLSKEDHIKVLRLIVYFTSLASFVYCLQPFFGTSILHTVGSDVVVLHEKNSIQRYFNNPVFMMPSLLLFLIPKEVVKIKFHILLAFINLIALFLTQHRSLLASLILFYFLNLFFSNKIKIGRIILISSLGFVGLMLGNQLLGNRYTSGIDDLKDNNLKVSDIKYIKFQELPLLSTSDYRFFHFIERFNYVIENPTRAAFGVGLITEESKVVKLLHFTVGTTSEDNENVPQIATGDIAWSVFILNFGLVGTVIFIFFYLSYILRFLRLRKNDIVRVGFYTSAMFLFTSIYGTYFMLPFSFCIFSLYISYAYIIKKEETN